MEKKEGGPKQLPGNVKHSKSFRGKTLSKQFEQQIMKMNENWNGKRENAVGLRRNAVK